MLTTEICISKNMQLGSNNNLTKSDVSIISQRQQKSQPGDRMNDDYPLCIMYNCSVILIEPEFYY